MNGVPNNDMDGLVNAVDMGFTSVTSLLSDIYAQGKDTNKKIDTILDRIDSVFGKFSNQFDSTVGQVFGTLSGAFRNYQKLNYDTNVSILKTMKTNNSLLSKLIDSLQKKGNINIFDTQEKKKGKKYLDPVNQKATLGGKIINANANYEFNLKDVNKKTLDSFKFMLIELNKTLKVDSAKFLEINTFFKDMYTTLNLLNGILKPVALGFTLLATSLIILSYASLINVFKLVMILPLLGAAIGIFMYAILQASKGAGGGIMGAIRVWSLMRAIPEILLNLGKGVLYLSIGLLLFNMVGYDSILKLITTMIALGIAFNLMAGSDTNWSATSRLFIVIGLIFVLTNALVQTSQIKWDSVMKLPVFIAALGLALKIGGFYTKAKLSVMNIIGISLLMITMSLLQFNYISWEQVLKMNVFIALLGVSLRTIRKDMSVMGVIALGMIMMTAALLDFQELNWMTIIQIIGVVGLLGFVVNKFVIGGAKGVLNNKLTDSFSGGGFKGGGMIGFAFGLIVLAGALYLLTNVNWSAVLKLIAIIAVLGIVFKVFFNDRTTSMFGIREKRTMSVPSIIGFGLGMGLLVLALDAVSEIEWTSVFQLIALIVGIGIAFRIMGPNSKVSGMLGYALGLGILVLALDAMSEIQWEQVAKLVVFAVGLGAAMWLMKGTGFFVMIGMAIAIGVMTYALLQLDKAKINGFTVGNFIIFITGIAGALFFIGAPMFYKNILIGVGITAGIGIATLILAKALQEVSQIKFSLEGTLTFLGGVIVLGLAFTAIGLLLTGPQAVLFTVGAAAVLVIALVTYLMAHALSAISELSYNENSFIQFSFGIQKVINAWINLDPIATLASVVTAVAALPILIISLVAIGILKLISIVDFDLIRIGKFTQALGYLITSFNENISIWQTGKVAAKSLVLLPFLGMMFISSLVLGKISKTDINPKQIGAFASMLNLFVTESIKVLAENEAGMKKAQPGIKALSKLMSVASSMAKAVQDIANLRFFEYTVKDGKLVLSGQRSLTDKDFQNVGKSIAKLVLALVTPIQVIGSGSDVWRIGSDTIRNPFKNDSFLNGIENVTKISEVFKPLVDTIKSYANLSMTKSYDATNQFTYSLQQTARAYAYLFWKLSTIDTNAAKESIRKISDLTEVFDNFDTDSIKSLDKMFANFIDNLSNTNKWKKIHINTGVLVKNLQRAAKAINSINLEKAAALEVNVKQFGDRKISDNIVQAVEAFVELFGYITLSQQQQLGLMNQVVTNTGNTANAVQTYGANVPTATELKQDKQTAISYKIANAAKDGEEISLTDAQKAAMGSDWNTLDKNKDGVLAGQELTELINTGSQTNVLLAKLIRTIAEN